MAHKIFFTPSLEAAVCVRREFSAPGNAEVLLGSVERRLFKARVLSALKPDLLLEFQEFMPPQALLPPLWEHL